MKLKIDWQNHIMAFIATIIGIFIGLKLDQRQNDNETERRLQDFKQLIQEEVSLNVTELDTFLNQSHKHEQHLKFLLDKKIMDNVIAATQKQLDSVNAVWFPYPFIINTEKNSEGSFKVYFALSTFDYIPQATVWEAFRNTDLVNHLSAAEITNYTQLYRHFHEQSEKINTDRLKIVYLIDNRHKDHELMTLSQKDYLTQLTDLMHHSNMSADQALMMFKDGLDKPHTTKYPELNLDAMKDAKETVR